MCTFYLCCGLNKVRFHHVYDISVDVLLHSKLVSPCGVYIALPQAFSLQFSEHVLYLHCWDTRTHCEWKVLRSLWGQEEGGCRWKCRSPHFLHPNRPVSGKTYIYRSLPQLVDLWKRDIYLLIQFPHVLMWLCRQVHHVFSGMWRSEVWDAIQRNHRYHHHGKQSQPWIIWICFYCKYLEIQTS